MGDVVAERQTLMEHRLRDKATHNIAQADLSYAWRLSESEKSLEEARVSTTEGLMHSEGNIYLLLLQTLFFK